jgi:DNA polymerase-3 subunit epsilon
MQVTFKNLVLQRPLAVIDLETTGTDVKLARIVEISVLKAHPDGRQEHRTRRLNPEVLIPPDATAVHGITDADVATEPRFRQVARQLLVFLDGCDLCGYNLKKFDLRVLYAEFGRAGLTFSLEGRAIVDPMEIFHAREPRDLTAAMRFYCGQDHTQAHAAGQDAEAAALVLDAMLGRYADLPRSVAGLDQLFKDPRAVDAAGFFTRVNDEIRFAGGKYRGQPLKVVAQTAPDYLTWMLNSDFLEDTKRIVRLAFGNANPSL